MVQQLVPPEIAARIAALESKVARLYAELNLVEPGSSEAVAVGLPAEVAELARSGEREQAIRRLIVDAGISTVDAVTRIDGFLRSIGR
jgi:hypothetical protein